MIEQDLDRPWVPAGTRPFQIGDRVQIHLSGECRKDWPNHRYATQIFDGQINHGHLAAEDGRRGQIIPRDIPPTHADHPYLVLLDEPIVYAGKSYVACSYAASELKLIQDNLE